MPSLGILEDRPEDGDPRGVLEDQWLWHWQRLFWTGVL